MPLSPTDIPLHIELGQIGGALLSHRDEESWPLYAFTPNLSNNVDKVSVFQLKAMILLNLEGTQAHC